MGATEQNRFVEAARNARSDGGVETAAHMLSGLAMFDILPALAALDRYSRDRVLGLARTALAPGAFQRVQFAATVVSNLRMPVPPPGLPDDQAIYKQNGAFKFTPAQMGGRDWSSSEVVVPRGTQWVATYHTHPDVNPNAGNFSPNDIIIGRGIKKGNVVVRPPLVSYLGTPRGQIKKLTPPELLEGVDAENYGFLGKPEVVR